MAKNNTNINTKNTAGDIESDAFMGQLMTSLQQSAGAVSSYDTEIERGITDAIGSIQKGASANTRRIESAYDREKTYAVNLGNMQTTAANESRRGFATNTGVLKQIYMDTDKNLKDLEMRKQELIMAGEADAAGKIAELQLKELTFKQEAAQKAYSNMLSMANFGLAAKQEQRQMKAQTFQEKQALGAIALQFGLKVEPGDDIDSLINKAAPFVTERQALELAQLRQSIAESQARVAEMFKSGKAEDGLSDEDIMTFAQARLNGEQEIPEMSASDWARYRRALDDLTGQAEDDVKGAVSKYTNKSKFEEDMLLQGYPADIVAQYKGQVKTPPRDWKGMAATLFGPVSVQSTNLGGGGVGFNAVDFLNQFKK